MEVILEEKPYVTCSPYLSWKLIIEITDLAYPVALNPSFINIDTVEAAIQ